MSNTIPVRPDEPCEVCGGKKILKDGLWDVEGYQCGHCDGTGIEPVKQSPSQSSPFEDEGMGIGNEPNLIN